MVQQEIAAKQRNVQSAQAAIENPTALPVDKSAYEDQIRKAQAEVEDEQRTVQSQQQAFAQVQAVDQVTLQRQQEVAQQQAALDQQPPEFGTKRVIFATDRKSSSDKGKLQILNEKNGNGELAFGLCDVAVERQGNITNNILHWIQDRDADRFYSVQAVSLMSNELMWREVGTELAAASTHDALLFVHGFNVSFDDGCRRAAQIAYDIKFSGPVFLYSWPSHDSALAYAEDGEMAEATEPNFTKFMKGILAQHGIDHLHIIAHSMGNRIVMHTLFVEKLTPAEQAHLGQIIFAAPDVDRSYFEKNVLVASVKAVGVTLYASNHDQTLALSKVANCGATMFLHCTVRVGDARPDIEIKSGMDSIDASAVDTSLLGHSYIGASRSVLADFGELIFDNRSPDKRFGVLTEGRPPKQWWILNP
jgi:esterase/lipase superfamily enzyme